MCVRQACKVTYPSCSGSGVLAPGLSCFPTSSSAAVRRDGKGLVTCTTLTSYCTKSNEDASSSGGEYWESSSSGGASPSSSQISAGMIALVVCLILAGVGAIVGYLHYARKNSVNRPGVAGNIGTEGLLAPAHTSAPSASDFYYTAATQEGTSAPQ